MKKEQKINTYEITFYLATGKAIRSVTRTIKSVLNNGVVKKIAKEEGGFNYSYWVSNKID